MVRGRIILAKEKKVAELHLYGDVWAFDNSDAGEWGIVSLKTVQKELKDLGGADAFDEIMLRIKSPGGDVHEGFAIYNYIRSLGKPITCIADGRVASIATVIFLAGDVRKVYDTTDFMIHNPWTWAAGNADQLEETAEELRKIEDQILDLYVARTGSDRETIKALMQDDKSMPIDQVLELKFATEIKETIKALAMIRRAENPNNNMSKFKSAIKSFFTEIKNIGMVVAATFKTTDGTELEIDTGDSDDIAVGNTVTKDGTSAADGDYTLEDGRTITVSEGKITEIKPKEEEEEESEEMKALKAENADLKAKLEAAEAKAAGSDTTVLAALREENQTLKAQAAAAVAKDAEITSLKAQLQTAQTENESAAADVEKITAMLKALKVEGKDIPARFGFTPGKQEEPQMSKEEKKKKILELSKS